MHTHRYRVTNQEWDYKDGLQLIKYDDSVKSSVLNIVFEWHIYWHNNERSLKLAENPKYKEMDNLNLYSRL